MDASLSILAVVSIGCVHSITRHNEQTLFAVSFQLEDYTTHTFLTRPTPAVPLPARQHLVIRDTGSSGVALAGGPHTAKQVIFLLYENRLHGARLDAVQLMNRSQHPATEEPNGDVGLATPPCLAVSGFFVNGIGSPASDRIPMTLYNPEGNSATGALDPSRSMFRGRPALSVTTKQVEPLWMRGGHYNVVIKPLFFTDALVLAVLEEDGSYRAWGFKASPQNDGGIAGLVAKAGHASKWSVFVIADPRETQSPCRLSANAVS